MAHQLRPRLLPSLLWWDPCSPAARTQRRHPEQRSPNGCLQVNGTVKSSFLPLDKLKNASGVTPAHLPIPSPLTPHDSHQECHPEASPAAPPALASWLHAATISEYCISLSKPFTGLSDNVLVLSPLHPSACIIRGQSHFQHCMCRST